MTTTMMRTAESCSRVQKNNLSSAMDRFVGAVNNMDQTVMLPSMLRDLSMDSEDGDTVFDAGATPKSNMDDGGDMYSYYQLLKSMRRDMEWGVVGAAPPPPGSRPTSSCSERTRGTLSRKNSLASLSSTSSSSCERTRGTLSRKNSLVSLSSSSSSCERTRGTLSRKNSLASLSSASSFEWSSEDEEGGDEDLEKQFQYHLTGLQGVLSKLTRQAVCLTDRYKQELSIGEWSKTTAPNCSLLC